MPAQPVSLIFRWIRNQYRQNALLWQLALILFGLGVVVGGIYLWLVTQAKWARELENRERDRGRDATPTEEVVAAGELPQSNLGENPSLNEVIEGVIRSYNGMAALETFSSVQKTGTFTLSGKDYEAYYVYRRPNLIRYQLSREGLMVRLGFDGKQGWKQVGRDDRFLPAEVLAPEESRLLRENAELSQPVSWYFQQRVYLKLLEPETVLGVRCHVMRFSPPDDRPTDLLFDAETLLLKVLRRREPQDVSGKPVRLIEVRYSDFRPFAGSLYPFSEDVWVDDKEENRFAVRSMRFNIGILPDYFSITDEAGLNPKKPKS